MQQNSGEIFISYSRKDYSLVRRIKEEIDRSTGVRCWMDLNGSGGGIESGSPRYTKNLVQAINKCKVFLFMLSENSQASDNALGELRYAYKKREKLGIHVVCVNISNCELTDEFDLYFGLADQISWTDTPQHDKLICDLKSWVKSESDYFKEVRLDMTLKAREYFFNHKERKTFYLFSGTGWDGFGNDFEAAYYFSYTQAEINHFVQLFVDLYNEDVESEDDKARTLDDVIDCIDLCEFEGDNPEIDKLLEHCRDNRVDLRYIDSTPRYLYTMSYFYWDARNNRISNRCRFKVELTDEEYLYLLIEQLLDFKSFNYHFNYNILKKENPQLAIKIENGIDWTDGYCSLYELNTFLIIFDEILTDAEAIEGPLNTQIELYFDNSNQKWYRAIVRNEGHQLILEEEKESFHRQVYLNEIDADKVMNCLSANDYPNMFMKLKQRYHDADALSSIRSWLDFHEISYKTPQFS